MDIIQNPARIDALREKRSVITAPAGAFYQIADLKIELVLKWLFLGKSFHGSGFQHTSSSSIL